MDVWETVVWWVIGALVIVPLGLKLLGYVFWEARFRLSRATDKLARRFPGTMRDWSPVVLYLTLVGMFALILHLPTWAPWGYIADPARADEVMPLALLGAAAGLIALLTFAASHLKDIDKSAQTGDRYLGRNLATYVPLRSWWVNVLTRPFFAVITLVLFVIPLVLSALPQTMDPSAAPYLLWKHFSVYQMATALWCACFAVAAAVLLLNLFSVLGNAPNVALHPNWIRLRIERDLERRTGQEFAHLRSLRPNDQRHDAEAWARRHLQSMTRLPATEQELYLHRTLTSISIFGAEVDDRHHLIRSARRVTTLEGINQHPDANNTQLPSVWFRAKRWEALRRNLDRVERIQIGVISAVLSALASDDISPTARGALESKCLRAAEASDRLYAELVSLPRGKHSTEPAAEIASISAEIMLTKPSDVDAHLDGYSRMGAWRNEDEPRVLQVTALVFKRLTPLVFGVDPEDEADRSISRRADKLIDSANILAHASTTNFALRTVADAAVRFATASNSSAADSVQKTLKWRLEGPGPSWSVATEGLPKSRVADAIESAAVSQLVFGDAPSAVQITRLLQLVDGWRVPAAFLHRMYYGRRSHRRLSPNQLHAFSSKLTRMSDPAADGAYNSSRIVEFLTTSGYIGHFVVGDGVRWLLDARERTLSLELCADFIKQAKRNLFSDFYFVDFLLWHMTSARRPYFAEHFGSALSNESAEAARSLRRERHEIELLANEWSGIDEFTASRICALLQAIPIAESPVGL